MQTGIVSKRLYESSWFWHVEASSTYPTLRYKEIWVISNNSGTFWNFSLELRT